MQQRWEFDDYAVSALALKPFPASPLGSHQVRVTVKAQSLNYRDLLAVEGWYNRSLILPATPLSDCSGEVVEIGSEVSQFEVGDGVVSHYVVEWQDGRFQDAYLATTLGTPGPGVAANEVVLPETALVAKPKALTHAQASTLPIAALTAWASLHAGDPLGPGSFVLALGTGGVSVLGLQLAASMGATTIITSKADGKLDTVKRLGIDHGVNYQANPDWHRQVLEITGGRGVDLVLEAGGGATLNQSLQCLRAAGTVALFGVLTGPSGEIETRRILARRLNVRGIYVASRTEFERMNGFIDETGFEPYIGERFGFDQLPDAFESMKSQGHIGKIVTTL